MLGILFFFVLYWMLLEILPLVPGMIVGLVGEVIWPLFIFLCESSFKIIGRTARLTWNVAVFFYLLADEVLHTEDNADHPFNENAETEEDPYIAALTLLGLQEDCTHAEFTRAFRSAIALAHPDRGGTNEQAMALNAARNIVRSHKGWRL